MTRVLVVDDKEENRYFLEALLTGSGYEIDVARHGAEALVLARQRRPDIVVADLLMPVMDGYTLLRQWRADPDLATVPFIVFTATYTEAEDERLAMDLGADAFILKPAEPEDFLSRLRDVEARAAAARPAHEDTPTPNVDDAELLRSYSTTLIRKLEEKTFQLERTNQVLLDDIDERERIEAALRSSERENRLIIESIPQLVWIAAPDGSNLLFNRQWLDYTGLTPEESIERGWDLSIHPGDRPESVRRWTEAIHTGTPFEMEFRLRRSDGTHRWMLSRSVPMLDDRGVVEKWFGTCTDIDDLKRMEAQFLRAQRLESIGTLAGGIAHDLNNVLAPIVTGAGLLDGPGLDPDTRAIVETIVTSAQRGADLVRQVLAYARGVEGERVVVDVGASVSEVVAMIASTFPKDVHVDLELSEGLWEVVGDPTQLQQVVLNLCVNARDAVGSFGRIRVAARNVERPGSVLTTHGPRPIPTAGGRFVAIAVTDDGPGVPPELADRIFDPFVTTKPIGEGSGLGLATVASIVTGHGGAIDVRSHPGQGSTFEVLFPVQGDPQHTVRATLPARAVRPVEDRSLHVLLVDDERAIVETAQRVLESLGYRVTASWQSADLCASLEARVASGVGLDEPPADVVVTDLVMPEVDGGRLVRMIRSQWPDLPAVVMTGGDPGHVLDSVPGPTPVLLPKPFTAEALRNAVAAALDAAT